MKKFEKTIVRSVRINEKSWDKLGEIAKGKDKSRNLLVVEVLEEYCKKSALVIDKRNNL